MRANASKEHRSSGHGIDALYPTTNHGEEGWLTGERERSKQRGSRGGLRCRNKQISNDYPLPPKKACGIETPFPTQCSILDAAWRICVYLYNLYILSWTGISRSDGSVRPVLWASTTVHSRAEPTFDAQCTHMERHFSITPHDKTIS